MFKIVLLSRPSRFVQGSENGTKLIAENLIHDHQIGSPFATRAQSIGTL